MPSSNSSNSSSPTCVDNDDTPPIAPPAPPALAQFALEKGAVVELDDGTVGEIVGGPDEGGFYDVDVQTQTQTHAHAGSSRPWPKLPT
jgi:hypothetical protein